MARQDDYIRTALRVPPDLHAKLHEAAQVAGRSFNNEIVARLQETFDGPRLGFGPGSVGDQMRKAEQAELVQKISAQVRDELLPLLLSHGEWLPDQPVEKAKPRLSKRSAEGVLKHLSAIDEVLEARMPAEEPFVPRRPNTGPTPSPNARRRIPKKG